jgi:transposase
MNKIFSSRQLAKALKSNLAFMYLAGNNKPDFRTINNFRKYKGKELEKIFVEIVLLAKEV